MFTDLFKNGIDDNSQLCIYVDDQCVLDLSGSTSQDQAVFNQDSLTTIFSSGKSVASILLAILAGEGRLKFSDPICKHWPEFAQNGKETLTIADLMRHETGLQKFKIPIQAEWLTTENIKKNVIGKIIEEEFAEYPQDEERPNLRRSYHP